MNYQSLECCSVQKPQRLAPSFLRSGKLTFVISGRMKRKELSTVSESRNCVAHVRQVASFCAGLHLELTMGFLDSKNTEMEMFTKYHMDHMDDGKRKKTSKSTI